MTGQPQEFDSFGSFALHLLVIEHELHARTRRALERALVVIEKDAKKQIGYYQGEVGEFPAWAPLADSTEAEKARLGAPPNAPLLRHGLMYASFGHTVESDTEGVVGSTDPTMIYHEFGTSKMPPRPVLGPAAIKSRVKIQRLLGHALIEGILGGEVAAGGKAYMGGDITP